MRDSGHDLEDPTVNCPECKGRVPMEEIGDHYAQCIQGLVKSVARFHMSKTFFSAKNLRYKSDHIRVQRMFIYPVDKED